MSVSLTIPDFLSLHPACPEWCAGQCTSFDWDGLHHHGPPVAVPLGDNEGEAFIAQVELTRLDIDGVLAPAGVALTVNGSDLFTSLSLDSAKRLATVLLKAIELAEAGAL